MPTTASDSAFSAEPTTPGPRDPVRRLAYLIQGDESYGVRVAALSLIRGVKGLGWEVAVLAVIEGPFTDECRRIGLPVFCLNIRALPNMRGALIGRAALFLALRRQSRQAAAMLAGWLLEQARAGRPFDALHFQWPSFVSLGGMTARAAGLPAFWEMPNILGDQYPFGLNRRIYRRKCRAYGITPLANSHYTAGSLGGGEVRVMHLGIDAARFDPGRVQSVSRSSLGIADNAIVLGIVARLEPSKGQGLLLDTLLALRGDSTVPPLHLLLVGGAPNCPYADELRRRAAGVGAADSLTIVPSCPDPERYYRAMDIPANVRIDAEPYGLTVVEAMMMGRPVLVHAAGGPAETVIDGKTGWHVNAPTVEAMAAGIRRAIAEQSQWPSMGEAARQHALSRFTLNHQIDFYRGVVEEVLADRVR